MALTLKATFWMFYLVNTSDWGLVKYPALFVAALLDSLLQNGIVVTDASNLAFSLCGNSLL